MNELEILVEISKYVKFCNELVDELRAIDDFTVTEQNIDKESDIYKEQFTITKFRNNCHKLVLTIEESGFSVELIEIEE